MSGRQGPVEWETVTQAHAEGSIGKQSMLRRPVIGKERKTGFEAHSHNFFLKHKTRDDIAFEKYLHF